MNRRSLLLARMAALGVTALGSAAAFGQPPAPSPASTPAPNTAPELIRLTGTASAFGIDEPSELLIAPDGRFAWRITGKVPYSSGWDGERAWQEALGDAPQDLSLTEREEQVLLGQVLGGAWESGGVLELAAGVAEGGHVTRAFTIRGGETAGEIVLNQATGRVESVSWGKKDQRRQALFRGWREAGGRWVPGEVELPQPSGSLAAAYTDAATAPITPGVFAPTPAPPRATFDPAVPAALDVKRAKTGHLLVKPVIDGSEAGWFIFDSGAGMTVIDTTAAKTLGLETFGNITASGSGGNVGSPLASAGTLRLGNTTIRRPLLLVLDLAAIGAAMGEEIGGVIGYDVLSAARVSIDMKQGAISLEAPAAPGAGEAWTPMHVYRRRPCVEATVEGHRGWFMLDSGAGNIGVTFYAPAVERLKLLEGREVRDATSGGVGGFRASKRGTVAAIEFAGIRRENVPATFDLVGKGASSDTAVLGLLGGGVLNDHVLVLEYAGNRLMLRARETP